jgi:hypothetical protein
VGTPDSDIPFNLLDSSEHVDAHARADDAILVVTDRRLGLTRRVDRFELDVPFERLRRIQFDIEKTRPATLVIVPELPTDEPVVLAIRPEQYEAVALAMAAVGRRIYTETRGPDPSGDLT